MLGDIKSRGLMVFKAILFVVIGIISGVLLVVDEGSTLRRMALLLICVWAFCRTYYFAFYVITAYLDPNFKYSGILAAVWHLVGRPDLGRSAGDAEGERRQK